MAAIESARCASCRNNLRQIALAATQYETQPRQYPLNWGAVTAVGTPSSGANVTITNTNGVSWLTSLLPDLEGVRFTVRWSLGQTLRLQRLAAGYQQPPTSVILSPVKTFLCPSDNQKGFIGEPVARAQRRYVCHDELQSLCGQQLGWKHLGRHRAVDIASIGRNFGNPDGVDHGNGVICRGGGVGREAAPRSSTANRIFATAPAKTFLAGETVPECCGWSLWFWFEGSTATCGIPLNYRVPGKAAANQCGQLARHLWLHEPAQGRLRTSPCAMAACSLSTTRSTSRSTRHWPPSTAMNR